MPGISEEQLKEQIDQLMMQESEAIANLHSIRGAIQVCQHLLTKTNNDSEIESAELEAEEEQ